MNYTVVRNNFVIAETRWYEDAKAILDRWHSGYIACEGKILLTKNLEDK